MPRGIKGSGKPRAFNDIFSKYKTYDPEKEGFGSSNTWKGRFKERMGYGEAVDYLDDDDPLKILGFSKMPTMDELKSTYRKLIFKNHPDRGGDTETAQKIIAAYTVLLKKASLNLEGKKMRNIKDIIREEVEKALKSDGSDASPKELKSFNKLLKLAGMQNKSGYYDADEWLEKTGVDPRDIPEYVKILKNGLCVLTNSAINVLDNHFDSRSKSLNSLGVGSSRYPSNARFIEEIKSQVREEVEKALREMTTTADIGGYTVPLGSPPANFKQNEKSFNKNSTSKKPKAKSTKTIVKSGKIKKGNKAPFTEFADQTNIPFKHKSRTTKYGVSTTPASSLVGEARKQLDDIGNSILKEAVYDLYRLSGDTDIGNLKDGSPSISDSYVKVKSFSSIKAVNNYAKKQGWRFQKSINMFGGYFVDPKTEDIYDLDIGTEPSFDELIDKINMYIEQIGY